MFGPGGLTSVAKALLPHEPEEKLNAAAQAGQAQGMDEEQVFGEAVKEAKAQAPRSYAQRYGEIMKEYGSDARARARAEADAKKRPLALLQGLAGIGSAIAGRDPRGVAAAFDTYREGIDDRYLGEFDRRRAAALESLGMERQLGEVDRAEAERAAMKDPASPESRAWRAALMEAGVRVPENLTAAQAERSSGALKVQLAQKVEERRREFEAEQNRLRDESAERREGARADKNKQNVTTRLRKEFAKQSEDFQTIQRQYDVIAQGAKDPTGFTDLGLVFGYMKILDPTSVVRESEYATAANTGSVPQRIIALYNSVVDGQKLSESQRAELIEAATRQYQVQAAKQQQRRQEYRQLAITNGLDPDQVTLDVYGGVESDPEPASGPSEPAGGKVRVRAPDGRVGLINRSDVQSLLDAGGEVIE